MKFARLMASPAGRLLRVLVGLSLLGRGSTRGSVGLMAAGLVPLLAGLFNVCVLAPLLHAPFRGSQASSEAAER